MANNWPAAPAQAEVSLTHTLTVSLPPRLKVNMRSEIGRFGLIVRVGRRRIPTIVRVGGRRIPTTK